MIYDRDVLRFDDPFMAQDTLGQAVSRLSFFEQLATGQFLPVVIPSAPDAERVIRLVKFPQSVHRDIAPTVAAVAGQRLWQEQWIGRRVPLPAVEMDNWQQLADKGEAPTYVLLKAWFIACKPCVAEIPALNAEVQSLKHINQRILYLAPVFDNSLTVADFLRKQPMAYRVVPNQRDYWMNEIGVPGYPTHFLLNADLKVLKVGRYEPVYRLLRSLLKD